MIILYTHIRRLLPALYAILSLSLLCSCKSLTGIPHSFISDPFGNVVASLNRQSDPELVKQAFPTVLIGIDSLLQAAPKDKELLYAATSGYSAYCQAFLLDPEDEPRAARLYEQSKGYAFRLLTRYPAFSDFESLSFLKFQDATRKFKVADAPHVFAIASTWLGWILTHSESMEAIADLPLALELMKVAVELDETISDGAGHVFFGIFYAAQPRGAGQDLELSKKHFERAFVLGGENNLVPFVAYAEYYARALLDETLFSETLEKLFSVDIKTRPDIRLLNEIARKRAQYLLDNMEDLF